MRCEACERGDHANCGLQTWCDCNCDPEMAIYDHAASDQERALSLNALWKTHEERPQTSEPITALIAVRDRDETTEVILLGIYIWRGDGWESEDSGERLDEERGYWWVLEEQLLQGLPL